MRSHSRKLVAILAADIAGYSKLMGADEERTVSTLKAHQAAVLPKIDAFNGRLIDTAGDGILAEFASVVDAVECAIDIQCEMADRNQSEPSERKMFFRMGVNLGDVVFDDQRIYGDGINIAARLEGLAEPGGLLVSRQVYDQVEGKLQLDFRSLGILELKNIVRPVEVFEVGTVSTIDVGTVNNTLATSQQVNYCRTKDGIRLAYATAGSGPALVKAANWMNHLEYDWESPIMRHLMMGLARNRQLVRFDARGNGMSDWDVDDLSLESWVADLETVVDAAGINQFSLVGISQGCAVSIAYAVQHPERVTRLILYGGFAVGAANRSPDGRKITEAMATLMRAGWGADNPAFRQMFTTQFMPDASPEQADSFNELQRRTTTPDCAARYLEVTGEIDVRHLLPEVSVPTLVMHSRGDARAPFEGGRQMAAAIPGARFVALPGDNHILLQGTPAADRFFEEIDLFLSTD